MAASKDHDKKAFGGKQAPAFGKGKEEAKKAKAGNKDKKK
jgi:hypothetical protein